MPSPGLGPVDTHVKRTRTGQLTDTYPYSARLLRFDTDIKLSLEQDKYADRTFKLIETR